MIPITSLLLGGISTYVQHILFSVVGKFQKHVAEKVTILASFHKITGSSKRIVSKKSTSHREYSVNLPKSTTLGSRFGKCTCGFPKKEGIPCQHMVAVCKLGRMDGLSRSAIMPHWYTTVQWRNQFPKNSYIDTHQTLKSIKAKSTPHDDLRYCPNWLGPQKKGHPKKEKRKKSIADYVKQSAKKKHRTTADAKTLVEERVDLEGKDVKDGQEGKA